MSIYTNTVEAVYKKLDDERKVLLDLIISNYRGKNSESIPDWILEFQRCNTEWEGSITTISCRLPFCQRCNDASLSEYHYDPVPMVEKFETTNEEVFIGEYRVNLIPIDYGYMRSSEYKIAYFLDGLKEINPDVEWHYWFESESLSVPYIPFKLVGVFPSKDKFSYQVKFFKKKLEAFLYKEFLVTHKALVTKYTHFDRWNYPSYFLPIRLRNPKNILLEQNNPISIKNIQNYFIQFQLFGYYSIL